MITFRGVGVRVGPRLLLSGVSFRIAPGDRIGLVGRNCAGKTTLLDTLAGLRAPAAGTVTRTGSVGRLAQDSRAADPAVTVTDRILSARGPDRAARVAAGLGLPTEVMDRPVGLLSGGRKRRVELARILFAGHGREDTLLLDEPTDHLDADSIGWLRGRLAAHRGGLVLISHDVRLLADTVDRVFHLDPGRAALDVHNTGRDAYLAQRESDERRAERVARIRLPEPAPCGRTPLGAVSLTKAYGERPALDGVDLAVDRGSRLVVLGLDGAGKTTLLKLLAGREIPGSGRVVRGHGLRLGHFAQEHDTLDPGRTVRENLAATERFYVDGLGLEVQWRSTERVSGRHDLLMVGPEDGSRHFELTRDPERPVEPAPTAEDLFVVCLGAPVEEEQVERLLAAGGAGRRAQSVRGRVRRHRRRSGRVPARAVFPHLGDTKRGRGRRVLSNPARPSSVRCA